MSAKIATVVRGVISASALWMTLFHMADGRTVWVSRSNIEYVETPSAGQCSRGTHSVVHLESGHDLCLQEDPETVVQILDRR